MPHTAAPPASSIPPSDIGNPHRERRPAGAALRPVRPFVRGKDRVHRVALAVLPLVDRVRGPYRACAHAVHQAPASAV